MELPTVLHKDVTGDRARVDLGIRADLGWFEGHFPGHLVLPGVVQLAWVVHFCREIFGCGPEVNALEQIKFKRPIAPGQQISLLLTWHDDKVGFEYRSNGASFASGTLKFKSST